MALRRSGLVLADVSLVRKLLHIAMCVVPAVGWYVDYRLALGLAALFFAVSMLVEGLRRWLPSINGVLWRLLPSVFREEEDERVMGSSWFSVGMLLTLLAFGRDIGGTAVLFLAWGDPAAEFFGRMWGKAQRRKTVAGTAGCLAACCLVCLVGVQLAGLEPAAVFIGAAVAGLVERYSPPPDDNVWMPILSGLSILLVKWFAVFSL